MIETKEIKKIIKNKEIKNRTCRCRGRMIDHIDAKEDRDWCLDDHEESGITRVNTKDDKKYRRVIVIMNIRSYRT